MAAADEEVEDEVARLDVTVRTVLDDDEEAILDVLDVVGRID